MTYPEYLHLRDIISLFPLCVILSPSHFARYTCAYTCIFIYEYIILCIYKNIYVYFLHSQETLFVIFVTFASITLHAS